MVEINIPEINVDELMEKIRAEVRGGGGQVDKDEGPYSDPVPVSSKIGRINSKSISEYPSFKFKKNGYHINDFLAYHDRDFVINAYRGALRRLPDPVGLEYYLNNINSGTMTKAEVLGRLRYSPEGRVRKVKIRGLFRNFAIQSSFRIPVLGYFSRILIGIINLPVIIRNFGTLEATAVAQFGQQRNQLNELFAKVKTLVDSFDKHGSELSKVAEQKADRAELSKVAEQKADRAELSKVAEQKAGWDALEQKADRAELSKMAEQKADRAELEPVSRRMHYYRLNILDQERRLRLLLEEARKRLPEPLSAGQIENMLVEEDHLLNAMYVSFEDQFRGKREDIKERQQVYLSYIQDERAGTKEAPILDIGCGRGEWLELCKEEGLVAKGVDTNRIMVSQCQDLVLDVIEIDILEFLKDQKSNSFGAITAFHVIEHLPLNILVSLLEESFRTLKHNGIIILETPNPDNIIVASRDFYLDPTHKKPIPSRLLQFMIEDRGFSKVEIVGFHPMPDYMEEKNPGEGDDEIKRVLNKYFYGPQDYAVIAYKYMDES